MRNIIAHKLCFAFCLLVITARYAQAETKNATHIMNATHAPLTCEEAKQSHPPMFTMMNCCNATICADPNIKDCGEGFQSADDFGNTYCDYWSGNAKIPPPVLCPEGKDLELADPSKLPIQCQEATKDPQYAVDQNLKFGGITLAQFKTKEKEFITAIAISLAVPSGDVKIVSAEEIEVRRRSLLSKQKKVAVKSKVYAKDKAEAEKRRQKMASGSYEKDLQKNAKQQTGISTLTAEADPPGEIVEEKKTEELSSGVKIAVSLFVAFLPSLLILLTLNY